MNDTPAAPPPRAQRQRRTVKPQEAATAAAESAEKPIGDDIQAEAPRVERPPVREALREPIRPQTDSREAADARTAEILQHLGGVDEGTDEFFFDVKRVPAGWSYEWKRHTVHGQHDPAYAVSLARMGWTAVPASRHPEMMPDGWAGNTIERKGQILMERPAKITEMVQARNLNAARQQVRVKEQQLASASSKDQAPRAADGVPGDPAGIKPRVSKSFEPMPIPADK